MVADATWATPGTVTKGVAGSVSVSVGCHAGRLDALCAREGGGDPDWGDDATAGSAAAATVPGGRSSLAAITVSGTRLSAYSRSGRATVVPALASTSSVAAAVSLGSGAGRSAGAWLAEVADFATALVATAAAAALRRFSARPSSVPNAGASAAPAGGGRTVPAVGLGKAAMRAAALGGTMDLRCVRTQHSKWCATGPAQPKPSAARAERRARHAVPPANPHPAGMFDPAEIALRGAFPWRRQPEMPGLSGGAGRRGPGTCPAVSLIRPSSARGACPGVCSPCRYSVRCTQRSAV